MIARSKAVSLAEALACRLLEMRHDGRRIVSAWSFSVTSVVVSLASRHVTSRYNVPVGSWRLGHWHCQLAEDTPQTVAGLGIPGIVVVQHTTTRCKCYGMLVVALSPGA